MNLLLRCGHVAESREPVVSFPTPPERNLFRCVEGCGLQRRETRPAQIRRHSERGQAVREQPTEPQPDEPTPTEPQPDDDDEAS